MITIALLAITSICSQGLSGLPTGFSSLCAELGLASPEWVEYGPEWQNMTCKWLSAETMLAKTGKGAMALSDVKSTGLPALLQEWALAQIHKIQFDYGAVGEAFGDDMLKWWDGLHLAHGKDGDAILVHGWCRNGQTGIVILILGMRWWAEHAGAGTQWTRVLREMTHMFEVVVTAPSL